MRKCKYCNEDISGYASGIDFCWLCAWGGWKKRINNGGDINGKNKTTSIISQIPK